MYCKQCGNKIGDQEKFCRQCGTKVQFQSEFSYNQEISTVAKPVLKRRDYFNTVNEKKVKNKIKMLNILTCIMLAVCLTGFICSFLHALEFVELNTLFNSYGGGWDKGQVLFMCISVFLMVFFCILSAVLTVLVIRYKHFGFTIPLLFIGAYPIVLSSGGIYKLFGFQIMTGTTSVNGHRASYYAASDPALGTASQIASLFQLIMYGVLIAILVLSILITLDYRKYKKTNL